MTWSHEISWNPIIKSPQTLTPPLLTEIEDQQFKAARPIKLVYKLTPSKYHHLTRPEKKIPISSSPLLKSHSGCRASAASSGSATTWSNCWSATAVSRPRTTWILGPWWGRCLGFRQRPGDETVDRNEDRNLDIGYKMVPKGDLDDLRYRPPSNSISIAINIHKP